MCEFTQACLALLWISGHFEGDTPQPLSHFFSVTFPFKHLKMFLLMFIYFVCSWVSVCTWVCVHACPCWGQKTAFQSKVALSTMWGPRIELLSGLMEVLLPAELSYQPWLDLFIGSYSYPHTPHIDTCCLSSSLPPSLSTFYGWPEFGSDDLPVSFHKHPTQRLPSVMCPVCGQISMFFQVLSMILWENRPLGGLEHFCFLFF